MRMRKKKNLVPRMEACGALLVADPRALRGRWRELLPGAKELRVELGCGKGRFTAETAAAEPDVLLIAVEKVPDAMVVAMERARDVGLHNVFFVDGDAACLPDFFAPGEVDRIYINFCDPWPKSNQKKRRLTHGNFLQLYRRVLPPGRRDPLQKRQRQAVRVVPGGDPPVRLPAVPGHPGPPRRRPRGGYDGLRGQILSAGSHHQPVRGHHGPLGGPYTAGGVG